MPFIIRYRKYRTCFLKIKTNTFCELVSICTHDSHEYLHQYEKWMRIRKGTCPFSISNYLFCVRPRSY